MKALKYSFFVLWGILMSCSGKKTQINQLPPVLGEAILNETGNVANQISLLNQEGKQFKGSESGKIQVVDFMFTSCPTICPKMTNHLKEVQRHFIDNDKVKILSYSIDGPNDTPDVLKSYANSYGIDTNQWQLITGERSAIFQMSQAYKVMAYDDSDDTERNLIHDGTFVLVDDKNQIRGYYNGLELKDTQRLISDMEKLLNAM